MNLESMLADPVMESVYHEMRRRQRGILFYRVDGGRELAMGAALATSEALRLPLLIVTHPQMRAMHEEFIESAGLLAPATLITRHRLAQPRFAEHLHATLEAMGPYIISMGWDILPRAVQAKSYKTLQALMRNATLRFFSARPNGLALTQTPLRWKWGKRFPEISKARRIYGGFRESERVALKLDFDNLLRPNPIHYRREYVDMEAFAASRDVALAREQDIQADLMHRFAGGRYASRRGADRPASDAR